jgi:predicted DNA-binding transcriptional regulator AlpA
VPPQPWKPPPADADRLMTILEVASALRCCKRTVQRMVKRGKLPSPIHLSAQKRLWRTSDIRKVVESLHAAANGI